ncbi:MAG: DoxX family protein [Prevotellaceae bacterium]|jgi:putative oxidoreductase|nr:DoxX family protein [Prevotellaceae bacterium]
MIKKLLFPSKPDSAGASALLLLARIAFGLLFMSHGIQKWMMFQDLSATFPDPLGIGSYLSLLLAIFGEMACSIAFIGGILYRLAMIPMIFTMCIAFFVVHGGDAMAATPGKEMALIYLIVFVLMYIAGPGKFSVDHWIGRFLDKSKPKR